MSKKLNPGDAFPAMTLAITDGGTITLPTPTDDGYQVILFYRGSF